MTLYEFILLDEKQQAEAVWSGVHIAEREENEYKILLYQLDSFYVEVFYNKKYNVIKKFRPFSSIEVLAPYLEQIKIDLK